MKTRPEPFTALARHQRCLILWAVFCCAGALPSSAEVRIADIRQGTNLTVAIAPDGRTLVVDLLGQLWVLPTTGGGAEPLTPPDEPARNPRFSPDGSRLVYQQLVAGQWDLWLLDLATRSREPLTATPLDEREPDFSADGRAVVFAGNRTGHYCLWSMDLDARVETQLTEEVGDASFPSVSEHGLIAYVLDRDNESALRVLGANGASSAVHTSSRHKTAPSWRPGGGVLVFGERDGTTTSQLQMLLLGEPRVLKPLSGDEDLFNSRAAWVSAAEFIYSADGQLWRRGIADGARRPVHLFAAAAVEAFATPTDLPPFDDPGPRPAFGVNGQARSADDRRTTFTALGDLWLAERGELERLTDDAAVDLDPAFSPDGEAIVFASERTGQFELWRLTLRDRRLTQLTFGALKPHRPAIRPDGTAIAFLETDGFDPSATARLSVLEGPSGGVRTVAVGLVGASTPVWSDDGLGLRIHARSAEPTTTADARLHVELIRDLTPPSSSASTTETLPAIGPEWRVPPAPADFVVRVGRLFDGVRAEYRRHVDLHVRGGRIAAIVGRGVLPTPTTVIDLLDATVIPGLIDLHAHQDALVGERLGRAWLAYGVTTVREVGPDVSAALERAETWASGRAAGPRLIATLPSAPTAANVSADPRAPVRAYPGVASGFAHSLSQQARMLAIPRRVAAGKLDAWPVIASARSYELEVSPGFSAYQDGFSRLIASGTVFIPGLGALVGLGGWPNSAVQTAQRDPAYGDLFTALERVGWSQQGQATGNVRALQQTVARLVRAGGRVALGSDAPAVPYGLGLHLELALLADAGVANDQVLRMATAEGALALGLERQVGTLEEDKLADFVVVDGDPLARVGDALRIVAVVKGGVWHDRAQLLLPP